MGVLVTQRDIDYLQSLYPTAGIAPLTSQEEVFLMHYLRGQSTKAAEEAAGMAAGRGKKLLGRENVQKVLEFVTEQHLTDVRVTRDTLTQMLFESHAKSANATEEVMCIRELGKMHGLYESDKQRATKINQFNGDVQVNNVKQIERASEDELLRLAGNDIALEPDQYRVTYDESL